MGFFLSVSLYWFLFIDFSLLVFSLSISLYWFLFIDFSLLVFSLSISLYWFLFIGMLGIFSLSDRAIALFGIPELHVSKPVFRVHALIV